MSTFLVMNTHHSRLNIWRFLMKFLAFLFRECFVTLERTFDVHRPFLMTSTKRCWSQNFWCGMVGDKKLCFLLKDGKFMKIPKQQILESTSKPPESLLRLLLNLRLVGQLSSYVTLKRLGVCCFFLGFKLGKLPRRRNTKPLGGFRDPRDPSLKPAPCSGTSTE